MDEDPDNGSLHGTEADSAAARSGSRADLAAATTPGMPQSLPEHAAMDSISVETEQTEVGYDLCQVHFLPVTQKNHGELANAPMSPTSLNSVRIPQHDSTVYPESSCMPNNPDQLHDAPLNAAFILRGTIEGSAPGEYDADMLQATQVTQAAETAQPAHLAQAEQRMQVTQPSPLYSDILGSTGATMTTDSTSQQPLLSPRRGMFQNVGGFLAEQAGGYGLAAGNTDQTTFYNALFLEDALLPDLSLNPIDDVFLDFDAVTGQAPLPALSMHHNQVSDNSGSGMGSGSGVYPNSCSTSASAAVAAPAASVIYTDRYLRSTQGATDVHHERAYDEGHNYRDSRRQTDRTHQADGSRHGHGEGGGGQNSLRITASDIKTLGENIAAADIYKMQADFRMPTEAAVLRALNAYVQYFDPHTPIIHWPTFSITKSQPALILAMIAIGARHLSEYRLAVRAYDAASILLSQHEIEASWCHEQQLSLWPIQATLLCAQFGAFSNDKARSRRSQYQMSFSSTMLRHGLDAVSRLKMMPDMDWSTWVYLQTFSRLASWATVLFSIVLAYDPSMSSIVANQVFDLPMPSDGSLWCARSSREWKELLCEDEEEGHRHAGSVCGGTGGAAAGEIGLFTAAKMLLQGETVPVQVTSFGLLVLIGSILSYICSHERLSVGLGEVFQSDFTARMEHSLAIWEQMWRSHPLAEQIPSNMGDPLMADCFSLLGSARFHLYVGKRLLGLKSIANDLQSLFHPEQFLQTQTAPTADVCKAVRYAANSWLVRVKIGLALLERMAALEHGGHTLVTAYEGALILSWWLSLDDHRRQAFDDVTNPREKPLDDIFHEIFELLAEQGLEFDDQPRYLAPIVFYRRLMAQAFWTYGLTMAQNLESFSHRVGHM
ncbi:hypothetical protein SCUCBS95973_003178 [Sporothrix curviconia]|uniref:Xylanolytic transcriptional activator regulatory domain-containing protein n=1 Tax=Sporothrix curviconia TaxID=1260050 RepID=A0ABP0BE71_9PEZI